jgi:hypothetical protein
MNRNGNSTLQLTENNFDGIHPPDFRSAKNIFHEYFGQIYIGTFSCPCTQMVKREALGIESSILKKAEC